MTTNLREGARLPGLDTLYLRRLVATPRGRGFLLNLLADAEISDEGKVFDELIARVDDPELHNMVRIHAEDEKRHNRMLLECLERAGVAPSPVPEGLSVTVRINRMLGDFAQSFVGGSRSDGVMQAYVLLLVLEERAVKQFPLIVKALEPVDPETAKVLARVLRDEQRHVLYARAISKRYAPDEATLARTLARYRDVEARAFAEHNCAMMRHVADKGLLDVGGVERVLWRALLAVNELANGGRARDRFSPASRSERVTAAAL